MQIGSSWPHIFWQLALHCNKALTQQILFSSPPAFFLSRSVRLLSVPSCIRQEEANCWETEETLVPKEELKKQAPNTNLIVRFDLNVPAHADLLFFFSFSLCFPCSRQLHILASAETLRATSTAQVGTNLAIRLHSNWCIRFDSTTTTVTSSLYYKNPKPNKARIHSLSSVTWLASHNKTAETVDKTV